MSAQTVFAVALAGGLGACLRYAVDSAITRRDRTGLPLPTLIINVTGSLGLGILTALAAKVGPTNGTALVVAIVGSGLLGGYTTFSTASVETARLLLGKRRAGAILIVVMPLLCLVGAAIGLGIGGRIATP